MVIDPIYPADSHNRYNAEWRQKTDCSAGEPPTEKTVTRSVSAPQMTAGTDVEEKACRIAKLIRERRENGYYHRSDVLREIVSRLLESRDLDRVGAIL